MSKRKTKFSERFPEDSLHNKITLQEFLKLKDNSDCLTKAINTSEEGKEVLETIKNLKAAVEDRITILATEKLKSEVNHLEKPNTNQPEKIDYVKIYKEFLKIKSFKDIPHQDVSDNSQERDVKAKLFFAKNKKNFYFNVYILDVEGDETVRADLSYEKKKLWDLSYEDCYDRFEGSFNKENCELVIKEAKLDEIDKREFELIIIDLSRAIIKVLEDKYGKEDEFGVGFGVTKSKLFDLFKKSMKDANTDSDSDGYSDEEDFEEDDFEDDDFEDDD